MRVDVVWLTDRQAPAPVWALGQVWTVSPDPAEIASAAKHLAPACDMLLFWDAALGAPDPAGVMAALEVGGDVWHSGLLMGMAGLPAILDYVNPAWRFTRDSEPDRVATSWRLSLAACLVRTEVIQKLGGPNAAFDTLMGTSLELGHRWISDGALMRHVPGLLGMDRASPHAAELTLVDGFRFVRARFGAQWARWALWRSWRNGTPWREALAAYRASKDWSVHTRPERLHPLSLPALEREAAPSVSVLIPTLDRYPYLFQLLDQLRDQTVPPLDIVVVDQTVLTERDWTWPEQFSDLPLRVIWRDEAGQCSSRNAGLLATRGETILFLDDDNEIETDLIERHLAFLQQYGVDGSIGISEEVGAGPVPRDFTYVRDSHVFSTGNSMLRKEALDDSGLFDLAYEHGARADGDLGMRLYLGGRLLVLNPMADVIHLHAPKGGLRQHNARVVTNASSEARIRERHFLSATEAYLLCRYFTPRQVDEAVLIRTFSTLGSRLHGIRRLMRMALMTVLLPDTQRRNRQFLAQGQKMLEQHPTIPILPTEEIEEIV